MNVAPIWLAFAVAWIVLIGLAFLRIRYPYKTIQTAHFRLIVPQPWLRRSIYVLALLELCRRTAEISFALPQSLEAEVEIRPGWWPAFWFQPESERIVLRFLFGPVIDRWLFSVDFGMAHEYGHFILSTATPVESEVWANLFCLYMLHVEAFNYLWPHWWEHWLIRRDVLVGLLTLRIWRFLPGHRREIAARFWELWPLAQQDGKTVVSAIRQETGRAENDGRPIQPR